MSFSPPPPPLPGKKRYRYCALYSWLSFVVAVGIYMSLGIERKPNGLEVPPMMLAITLTVLALTGVGAGGVALWGVRKHGSEGILAPAIAGIGLWVFSFGLTMPGSWR